MTDTIPKEMIRRWCNHYLEKYKEWENEFEHGIWHAALTMSIDLNNGWLDDEKSLFYRRQLCGGIECHECYGQGCEHSQ